MLLPLFCSILFFYFTTATQNSTLCPLCSYHGSCSNLTCVCLPNWSGPSCANFTDPCNDTICAHSANCTATNLPVPSHNSTLSLTNRTNLTTYTPTRNGTQHLHNLNWNTSHQCNCPSNYAGMRCEFEICDSSHCYNHGMCIHHPITNITRCLCYPQYSGDNCENCLQCPDDASRPCSSVSCTYGHCEVTPANHTCHCSIGFQGSDCDEDIDECSHPFICNNGRCANTIGSYYCNCANTGYSGKNCEEEIYECDLSPCKNGASCSEVPGSGYSCLCASGWSGYTCQVHACQQAGTCVHGACKRSPAPYTCDCSPGYEGASCDQDIDECSGVTCQNGGICQDGLNSYLCDCKLGYTGMHCQNRIDYCSSEPCAHGSCFSLLSGYTCGCDPGYTGLVCETNINDCDSNPCLNGTCLDGEHNYTCQCYSGYTGRACDMNIDDCVGNPCGVRGVCSDLLNTFTCTCTLGYTGQLCETSINYCLQINCLGHGTCIQSNCTNACNSSSDFFQCSCYPGFTGPLCGDDIDYCENHSCRYGECVENSVGYSCVCNEGFSGDFCTVNDSSCIDNTCQNGSCIEVFPKYRCECLSGFEGESCQSKIDLCENVTCLNGSCMENQGGSYCVCEAGFHGDMCESIDRCYGQPCLNGGNCTLSNASSYLCLCPANYSGSVCETSIHSCAYVECSNNVSCTDVHGIAICICSPGYTGQLCESEVEHCQSEPCQNNGTCLEASDGFNCTCSSQYAGERCELELTPCSQHFCTSDPNLLCVDSNIPNNSCYCPDNKRIFSCIEPGNSCNNSLCKNNGVCGAFKNGTVCLCTSNYAGENCQVLSDPCLSNPCNDGYCVAINQTDYECLCSSPLTGKFCESMVIPCEDLNNCSLNGTKLCIQDPIGHSCICNPAFSGATCSNLLECPTRFCSPPLLCAVVNGSFGCVFNSSIYPQPPNVTTYPQDTTTAATNSTSTNSPTSINHSPIPTTHSPTSHTSPSNFSPISNNTPTSFSSCIPQPCLHGNCTSIGERDYSCKCSSGFTGTDCDAMIDYCSKVFCANGGTCKNESDSAKCHCLPDFAGSLCLFELTEPEHIFDKCTNKECRHLFNNGQCNESCAEQEDCLFDGIDCLERPVCPNTDCESSFGNSLCNEECNKIECIFDGGDCFPDYLSGDRQFASGNLLITVESTKSIFSFHVHVLPFILYRISAILHTMVVVDYVSEVVHMSSRVRRQLASEYEYTYKIRSRIDNSLCEDYCFGSAAKTAEFLNEYFVNSSIDTDQFRVLQITSTEDAPAQVAVWQIATGVSLVTIIILVFVVIGGVIIRKKRPRGIYFPRRTSVHSNNERAALVESRSEEESVAVSQYPNSNNPAKRSRLDRTATDSKSVIPPSCSPPPYEAFQLPQVYLPNEVFPPINTKFSYSRAEPRASIELDHLLVDPSPPTEIVNPSLTSLNSKAAGGFTPLSLAVIIGNPTIRNDLPFPALPDYQHRIMSGMLAVEDLIKMGADANLANDEGATPLHLAAKYKRPEIAASLIAAGALVNKQDKMGRSPLHAAVASDARGVLQILLSTRSVNIDIQSHDGSTPLMMCVTHINNELLRDLLQVHASADLADKQGYTALHWAASVNNVVALQALIPCMMDIDCQDSRGQTALFLAAKEGSIDCARVLLQKHADPHITDTLCQDPMNVANHNLHKDIEQLLRHCSFSGDNSEILNYDSNSNCGISKCKGKSGSRSKHEPKRKRKMATSTPKVHPSPSQSVLPKCVNIKQEISSPSSQLCTPSPLHPLAAEYPTDPQEYQSNNPILHLSHSHPFPTPPNLHNEGPKQMRIDSLVTETCYASNFPSPESSSTTSPTDSKIHSLKRQAMPNASYPNHLLDAEPSSAKQTENLTSPLWD